MSIRLLLSRRIFPGSLVLFALALFAPAVVGAAPPCPHGEDPNGGKCHEAAAAETPRGLALGTGSRASSVSTSALAYNTAGLPKARLYHIEGDVDYQPNNDVVVLGASVVDSVTSRLAAGLSFRGSIANSDQGYSGIDFLLGLGYPFADQVSIGVSGRYVNLWHDTGPRSERWQTKGLTMDTSLRVQPVEMLELAFVAYNVIDRNSQYVPVTLGGSSALILGNAFNIGADCLVDISTFDKAQFLVGGGLEYISGGTLPLRIGYAFDSGRETHAITGGVGYLGDKFSADLALRQQVAGGNHTRLMAGVRIHIY
jgi:hypothetical protein